MRRCRSPRPRFRIMLKSTEAPGVLNRISSVWRLASIALQFRSFGPPSEVFGEAGEGALQTGARLSYRQRALAERLVDRADCDRAGDHHYAHLGKNTMPTEARASAGDPASGITEDACGSPEPFFEEMVCQ